MDALAGEVTSDTRCPDAAVSFRPAQVFLEDQTGVLQRRSPSVAIRTAEPLGFPRNHGRAFALLRGHSMKEMRMKKTFATLATVAAVATTSAPAEAGWRGVGPGLAFGVAAGALAAGAAASAYPYYYGPGYGYGPRYYYGPGPYAYYGGPYYRPRYWRQYQSW
jgi:hypothetical protein